MRVKTALAVIALFALAAVSRPAVALDDPAARRAAPPSETVVSAAPDGNAPADPGARGAESPADPAREAVPGEDATADPSAKDSPGEDAPGEPGSRGAAGPEDAQDTPPAFSAPLRHHLF
jgi:hypothetical protein